MVPADCGLEYAVANCPVGGLVYVFGDHEAPELVVQKSIRLEGIGAAGGKSRATIRAPIRAENLDGTDTPIVVSLRNLHCRGRAGRENGVERVSVVFTVRNGVRAEATRCIFHGDKGNKGDGILAHAGAELRLFDCAIKRCPYIGVELYCPVAELIRCRITGCKVGIRWGRNEEHVTPEGLYGHVALWESFGTLAVKGCDLRDNRINGLELPCLEEFGQAEDWPDGRFLCVVEHSSISGSWYPLAQRKELHRGSLWVNPFLARREYGSANEWISSQAESLGLEVDDSTTLQPLVDGEVPHELDYDSAQSYDDSCCDSAELGDGPDVEFYEDAVDRGVY